MKKRSDGRYTSTLTIGRGLDGKPIKKTFYAKTKAELQVVTSEARSRRSKGVPITGSTKTFEEFASFWLSNKKGIQPSTHKGYRIALNTHITPYFSHYLLKDIRQFHIEDFLSEIAFKKRLSSATIVKIKITLLQVLKEAIKRELMFINLDGIIAPKTNKSERQPVNEFAIKFITENYDNHRCGVLALALLYTGMRIGEAAALKWTCVDFANNLIHIKQSASYVVNQPENKEPKTKNSVRKIPLVEPLKTVLLNNKGDTEYVFTASRGKQLTQTALRRLWDSYIEFMNSETKQAIHFTPHQLRHTYATLLFEKGISVKTAQIWLGHSDIRTTLNIYTHLTNEQSIQEAQKLDFSH
jgi:integrase